MSEQTWGRVDAEGNVYVTEAGTERLVGAFPDATADEALAYFVRKFDDMIGRADLLDMRHGIEHWKASGLDFARLLAVPQVGSDVPKFHVAHQDHGLEKALDQKLIEK